MKTALLIIAVVLAFSAYTFSLPGAPKSWKATSITLPQPSLPQRVFNKAVARYPLQLDGWTLVIDKDVYGRFGQCRYDVREIGISAYHLELHPSYAVFDTICHELGHALAGPEAEHSLEWRAWEMALTGFLR